MFLLRLVFQVAAHSKWLLSLFIFWGIQNVSFAQNFLKLDSLKNNETLISSENFKIWTKNNGAVFFCSKDYSIAEYKYQIDAFEIDKVDTSNPPYISFVLYSEFDQISKNPYIINSGFEDSLVNQIECYVVCADKEKLERALKIYNQNYFILNEIKGENIYQIALKGICPKDLTFSISLYYDLLYEIFNPQYTTEEKLLINEEAIKSLNKETEDLKNRIKVLEETVKQMNKTLNERLMNLESRKKNTNG